MNGENMKLEIRNLHVSAEGKEIIKGLSLDINEGEFHVLMGPNGSGKTTLGKAIMGHPKLKITEGDMLVDGKSILNMKTDDRAKLGIFLLFQNPIEVDGIGFANFLHSANGAMHGNTVTTSDFLKEFKETSEKLKFSGNMAQRSLNAGFSGGEKKKGEVLQMAILKPKIAILDEPDSGLDVDAIKIVAENVNEIAKRNNTGILLITHYSRILNYMKPVFTHVMINGRIVANGGAEIIKAVESHGYEAFTK
jgi:Fe-S cluster assembly ATP-binding protein